MNPRPRDTRPLREKATSVVRKLRDASFEAYFAGGCVRDMLRSVEPKDFDIATSATPEEVIGLFRRTIPLGRAFGVVQVRVGGDGFEVATFRTETGYSDGRRPDHVAFSTAEEDVRRRDFTINGLLYDPLTQEVVDHVGGQRDLESKVLRAIGDPHERFREDKLRLLRAARFASTLGFTLEPLTLQAVVEHAPDITRVSAERIRVELMRMLGEGGAAEGVRLLHATGLADAILGHMSAYVAVTGGLLAALQATPRNEPLLACLLWWHAMPPQAVASLTERLRFSGEEQHILTHGLTALHQMEHHPHPDLAVARRYLRGAGTPLALRAAALLDDNGALAYPTHRQLAELLRSTPRELLWPPRLVDGHALRSAGLPPGPWYAAALTAVEDAQLRGEPLTAEQAVELARDVAQRERMASANTTL